MNHLPEIRRDAGNILLTVAENDRVAIATSIECLIDLLDAISPDPDLEDNADAEYSLGWPERGPGAWGCACEDRECDDYDNEDGGDLEPTLGSLGSCGGFSINQTLWAMGHRGRDDEREDENEHAGDVLDEPHDGLDQGDDEPNLGWSETCSLRGVGLEEWSGIDDTGSAFMDVRFMGEGQQQAREMLRGKPTNLHSNVRLVDFGWFK